MSQKKFLAHCRITLLDIAAFTASLTYSQQTSVSVEAVHVFTYADRVWVKLKWIFRSVT